jgi:S1-C subfamily serine protease
MLNSSGEVIGVNNLIFSPSGGSIGLGFAIPIDLVKRVVTKLIKYGKYIKPSIGIEIDDRINRYLKSLGISGVAVLGLVDGSDAQKKGLVPARFYSDGTIDFGDIILAADGKKVESLEDLDDILEQKKIGSTVELKILRGDKKITIPIKLIGLDS